VKLQEAYISESAVAGNWKLIGYMAPNQTSATATSSTTTNFKYEQVDFGESAKVTDLAGESGWKASNIVALNDCTVASGVGACSWEIQLFGESNGNGVTYGAKMTGSGAEQLTPSFGKLGTHTAQ